MNRNRAREVFVYLLSRDIYCRPEALRALSMTEHAESMEYRILVADTAEQCVATKEVDEMTYHIQVPFGHSVQRFSLGEGDFLRCHVRCWQAFSATGLFPLVAGYMNDGRPAYLGQMETRKGRHDIFEDEKVSVQYFSIVEGTRSEDLRFIEFEHVRGEDVEKSLKGLCVLVLRYTSKSYLEQRKECSCFL